VTADEVVARLLVLTRAESALIDQADADALQQLCDERAVLLDALPSTLPPELADAARDLVALVERNEVAATAAATEIRRLMGQVRTGRAAIGAYAPAEPFVSLDRDG
jgi:hypothetical protein